PGSVRALRTACEATIHLGRASPHASSGLPASLGGPPSDTRAGRLSRLSPRGRPFLTLLQVGFTEPPGSPRALVGSYPAVSPLPRSFPAAAVCFLWHCPAGHPGLVLPTTLPCGA